MYLYDTNSVDKVINCDTNAEVCENRQACGGEALKSPFALFHVSEVLIERDFMSQKIFIKCKSESERVNESD